MGIEPTQAGLEGQRRALRHPLDSEEVADLGSLA
jgi:hypothetical protein